MTAFTEIHRLVGRYAAVPTTPFRQVEAVDPPWLHVFQTECAKVLSGRPHPPVIEPIGGGGRSVSADTAWRVAVIEALERYATSVVPPDLPVAPASAMPYAIDLDALPRHSDRELARHRGRISRLDRDTPVRWSDGTDLDDGTPVQVPAAMVHLRMDSLPGERFWHSISTGVAAGPTRQDALFSAICEVVERDMLAVVWLQRMALPRLDGQVLSPQAQRLVWWCQRKYTRVHLFDATSEIGVPTVYCVLDSPHDPVAGLVVGASAGADLVSAAEHALTEAVTIPAAVRHAAAHPEQADEMLRGAVEIGRPDRRAGFDFLLRPDRTPPPAPPVAHDLPLTGPDRLTNLVRRCVRAGHRVYGFDLTTPELREIGLHVVRAVIPGLQPMAFGLHGRYLGHPRLYRLPALLGHPVHEEDELNDRPQPFA